MPGAATTTFSAEHCSLPYHTARSQHWPGRPEGRSPHMGPAQRARSARRVRSLRARPAHLAQFRSNRSTCTYLVIRAFPYACPIVERRFSHASLGFGSATDSSAGQSLDALSSDKAENILTDPTDSTTLLTSTIWRPQRAVFNRGHLYAGGWGAWLRMLWCSGWTLRPGPSRQPIRLARLWRHGRARFLTRR